MQVTTETNQAVRDAVGLSTAPQRITLDQTLFDRLAIGIGADPKAPGPETRSSLFYMVLMRGEPAWQELRHILPPSVLDGGGEWTFYSDPSVGSVVSVTNTLVSADVKAGSRGPMTILTIDTKWIDEQDALLATCTGTAIFY